ncbi:calpain-7-like [Argopecten irradians]|uniref:calpain-7-like n=1 Tax=Argopecten irradians TaxID=31199 RepID=UPI003719334D
MDPSNSPGDLGADPLILENDGKQFAYQAVENDKAGKYDTAMFYYNEAAQALLSAALAGSTMSGIITRANEYILRAEALRSNLQAAPTNQSQKSQEKMDLERATFLLQQAFDEDEAGNETDARELYTESCDLFLNIRKAAMERKDKTLVDKVTVLATKALERAEELKKKEEGPSRSPKPVTTPQNESRVMPPLGFGAFLDDEDEKGTPQAPRQNVRPQGLPATGLVNIGPSGYTKEEIATIRSV